MVQIALRRPDNIAYIVNDMGMHYICVGFSGDTLEYTCRQKFPLDKAERGAPFRLDKGIILPTRGREGKEESMAYFQREVVAGRVVEIYRFQRPNRKGTKQIRQPKTRPTPERMAAINEEMAEEKLRWALNANFGHNDLHLVLTYKREARPTPEEAKKHLEKFLRGVRAMFKRAGRVCKYITVTEYRRKGIHHHIVLSSCDIGALNQLWGKTQGHGHIHPTPLDGTGQYAQLASYLIKETAKTFREKQGAYRKRWNESRNLAHPQPKVRKISAKKFREVPEAEAGCYIFASKDWRQNNVFIIQRVGS